MTGDAGNKQHEMKKVEVVVPDLKCHRSDIPSTKPSQEEIQRIRESRHEAYIRYQRSNCLVNGLFSQQVVGNSAQPIVPYSEEDLLKLIDVEKKVVEQLEAENQQIISRSLERQSKFEETIEKIKRSKSSTDLESIGEVETSQEATRHQLVFTSL